MKCARPKTLLALIGCFGAVAAAASSPASAAAASCANVNITPAAGNLEAVRAAVQCLVNREREAHGESALRPNTRLQHAAQGHSEEMASENYFSHYAPDGSTPLGRMRASGYIGGGQIGYEVGENIAWGTLWLATPQAIVNAWMASPEHRANILDGRYRDSGIGVVARAPASLGGGQAGALYTQDFGTIVSPTGHASRHSALDSGRITSGTRTSERSKHGSTRRQVRHRHRKRTRHRTRHRRTARHRRRAGADQRSRRRHRRAGRGRDRRRHRGLRR